MSDVKDTPSAQGDVKEPAASPDVKSENAVPYARFKEINDKLKEFEAREAKRSEDDKAAREKKLMDEKKYQELLDQKAKELEDVKAEATKAAEIAKKYHEQQEKIRADALAKIPDDELKALASKFSDPADVLAFVNKLESQRVPPRGAKDAPPEGSGNPYERREGESLAAYSKRVDSLVARPSRSK